MTWDNKFTGKAAKQTLMLSTRVQLVLQLLTDDLRVKGPFPGKNWHNYGKLIAKKNDDKRHCHFIKGNPTYVCCWEVHKIEKCIEVYYFGTHEKAPY